MPGDEHTEPMPEGEPYDDYAKAVDAINSNHQARIDYAQGKLVLRGYQNSDKVWVVRIR